MAERVRIDHQPLVDRRWPVPPEAWSGENPAIRSRMRVPGASAEPLTPESVMSSMSAAWLMGSSGRRLLDRNQYGCSTGRSASSTAPTTLKSLSRSSAAPQRPGASRLHAQPLQPGGEACQPSSSAPAWWHLEHDGGGQRAAASSRTPLPYQDGAPVGPGCSSRLSSTMWTPHALATSPPPVTATRGRRGVHAAPSGPPGPGMTLARGGARSLVWRRCSLGP